ncbi:hypothetical protein [uncultured Enterovirga sp.]|uniref:hypothetical protein n=1 Tax=uncultured Enterovirga sp. TaxID=2026352 RepID=UPI0035C9BEB6
MLTDLGRAAIRSIFGLCLLSLTVATGSGSAQAQGLSATRGVTSPSEVTRVAYPAQRRRGVRRARQGSGRIGTGGLYFVEFRSRYALSYGHTFAAFGQLNGRGQIVSSEVAGLHPAGDSSLPWMIGHLLPVPSETGPSDGDLDEKYISARYRVTMNEAEYNKVVAKIRDMQKTSTLWSATVYNCNAFVGDIARFMGLKADLSTMLMPPNYINALRDLNNGQSTVASGAI